MEDEIFGKVIHSYTRADAIADGVLVDLSGRYPEEAGQLYKWPVACTAAVWALVEAAVAYGLGNDYDGVVWDILWMSQKFIIKRIDDYQHLFEVSITGTGAARHRVLKIVSHPGDDGLPVLTIMLPEES